MRTIFDKTSQAGALAYQSLLRQTVERIIQTQKGLFEDSTSVSLPLIHWQSWKEGLFLSVMLLCKQQSQVSPFFYEMISRWLIPHRSLQVVHFLSSQIELEDTLMVHEAVLCFYSEEDRSSALRNIAMVAEEITLGVSSFAHARRILEMKGVSLDEKISVVQSGITTLFQRKPKIFTSDIFALMHRFFLLFSETFKRSSDCHHLQRLIYSGHIFQRQLEKEVGKHPIQIRVLKTHTWTPFGIKPSLGLLIALRLATENEWFEKPHIYPVMQKHFLDFSAQEEMYLSLEEKGMQLRYVQWVPQDISRAFLEVREIKKELMRDFKLSIEQRVKKRIMPRNDEEILKNGVLLLKELRYVSDLPQVMIHFDDQGEQYIGFTLIIARLLPVGLPSIESALQEKFPTLKVFTEKQTEAGFLRKKIPKQISVLSCQLPASEFLQEDHSVDLLKARQDIVEKLEKSLGDFRDFNGGMIAKSEEAFTAFANSVGSSKGLLKKFFHSLFPLENRVLLSSASLRAFFDAFLVFSQNRQEIVAEYEKGFSWVFKRYVQEPSLETLLLEVRTKPGVSILKVELEEECIIGIFLENADRANWEHFENCLRIEIIH